MRNKITVRGRVSSGLGEANYFTQLTWFRNELIIKLLIDPYPGTLNIKLENEKSKKDIAFLKANPGIEIFANEDGFCNARCFAANIEGDTGCVPGAVVFPEVEDYPDEKLEIVSPVNIKQTLRIKDGDYVTVTIQLINDKLNSLL